MLKGFVVAASAALLLSAGHATADEAIYAPYKACMASCQAEESSCIDHIPPSAADPEALKADCISTKAACVADCQFLPIPPQDGGGQPSESAPQGQGGVQRDEPVRHQEPVPSQEPVQQEETAPQDPGQPEQPEQPEQPVQNDGAQQGGAPQDGGAQGQQETDTLNGTIKIYRFE